MSSPVEPGLPAWTASPPPAPLVLLIPADVDREGLQVQILEGLDSFQSLEQRLEISHLLCLKPELFHLGPQSFHLLPIESLYRPFNTPELLQRESFRGRPAASRPSSASEVDGRGTGSIPHQDSAWHDMYLHGRVVRPSLGRGSGDEAGQTLTLRLVSVGIT